MLFSTPFFLFCFLPIFFLLYWFVPKRAVVLLIGSAIFYGWSEPKFLFVVILSSVLDWLLGKVIHPHGKWSKACLWLGVASNLGLLVYAKYTVFGLVNLNKLFTMIGWGTLTVPDIALPLAVSFIVFEKITYLVDLHRRVAHPAASLLNYLNYVFLFPKLLAGPIVKYHDIEGQLAKPSHCYEDVREGTIRFIKGLAKKVLVADMLFPTVNAIFATPGEQLSPASAWIGLFCFTLQIYFDFSGYSDMAIGMGRVLGFRLLENFRNPYLATSFTDFWKRWHISLSSWIKEYLYIPLGGNRVSSPRIYFNLVVCFFLSGLWHGASWNFVTWGCFHGLMLVMDRAVYLKFQKSLPSTFNIALTFFLVMIGWVFFRCETFGQSMAYLAALFGRQPASVDPNMIQTDVWVTMAGGALLVFGPLVYQKFPRFALAAPRPLLMFGMLLLLILSIGKLSANLYNPFLYFRF